MATISAFIRTSAKKAEKVNVRFRLTDGRDIQLFHKSEIEVDPQVFDKKKQEIKAKVVMSEMEKTEFNNAVADRRKLIRSIYNSSTGITSTLLELKIDEVLHPEKYIKENVISVNEDYFELFDRFLKQHKVSDGRLAHYRVLKRILQRYELYRKTNLNKDTISKDTLHDIEHFMKNEPIVFKKFPEIYELIPESRIPKPRGTNTISGILSRYRTFCLWLIENEKTQNNPFKGFSINAEVYGSPFYLNINERNLLHKFDLSAQPQLVVQRDIFIFQCHIGCRISDLYRLKPSSIVNGAVEYIARKTKDERPITVRVPLNTSAKEILNKYQGDYQGQLFPFIAKINYNEAIRKMLTLAGITRIVTRRNPTTGDEEQLPLNEIASSQIARRTLIGNLYKKVKDPNLVGSLSGHVEGSKAFARYREIDDEIKIDLVKMLE